MILYTRALGPSYCSSVKAQKPASNTLSVSPKRNPNHVLNQRHNFSSQRTPGRRHDNPLLEIGPLVIIRTRLQRIVSVRACVVVLPRAVEDLRWRESLLIDLGNVDFVRRVNKTEELGSDERHWVVLVRNRGDVCELQGNEGVRVGLVNECGTKTWGLYGRDQGSGRTRTVLSSRSAHAWFPLRGCPNVTVCKVTFDGSTLASIIESNIATAAPSEWPTTSTRLMFFCSRPRRTPPRTCSAVRSCVSAKPL
jgi:hypothetical protein